MSVDGLSAGGSVLSAYQTTSQPSAPGSAISAARPHISADGGPACGASIDRGRKNPKVTTESNAKGVAHHT